MINTPPRIMVVDDMPANLSLMDSMLRCEGYNVACFPRGEMAIKSALKLKPDLIFLDINMPGMNGYEVCRELKRNEMTAEVPVIFISALNETIDKVKAFNIGGVDYITKPFQFEEINARLKTHLQISSLKDKLKKTNEELEMRVQEQVKEIAEAQFATIVALAKISESRDSDMGNHIERVRQFCKLMAERLFWENMYTDRITLKFIETLGNAALLHDIGKVGIEDEILRKPGKLTASEYDRMKEHSKIGAETLRATLEKYPKNDLLSMGMAIARSHHERWDGTGYPDRLAGAKIPVEARIMAIVDVYDALRSKRCYKEAFSHEKSLNIIIESSGKQFDPVIVDVFKKYESKIEMIFDEIGE